MENHDFVRNSINRPLRTKRPLGTPGLRMPVNRSHKAAAYATRPLAHRGAKFATVRLEMLRLLRWKICDWATGRKIFGAACDWATAWVAVWLVCGCVTGASARLTLMGLGYTQIAASPKSCLSRRFQSLPMIVLTLRGGMHSPSTVRHDIASCVAD